MTDPKQRCIDLVWMVGRGQMTETEAASEIQALLSSQQTVGWPTDEQVELACAALKAAEHPGCPNYWLDTKEQDWKVRWRAKVRAALIAAIPFPVIQGAPTMAAHIDRTDNEGLPLTTLNAPTLIVPVPGSRVYYHPIIGESNDGKVYTVTDLGNLGGRPVAWLKGKSGCVSIDSLTPYTSCPQPVVSEEDLWELMREVLSKGAHFGVQHENGDLARENYSTHLDSEASHFVTRLRALLAAGTPPAPTPGAAAPELEPMQQIQRDAQGVIRFRANEIVQLLLDSGPFDLNKLARLDFLDADRRQFAQLIGYSVSGYGGLSYAQGHESVERADKIAEAMRTEPRPKDMCTWTADEDEPCTACPKRVTALHRCKLLQHVAAMPRSGS